MIPRMMRVGVRLLEGGAVCDGGAASFTTAGIASFRRGGPTTEIKRPAHARSVPIWSAAAQTCRSALHSAVPEPRTQTSHEQIASIHSNQSRHMPPGYWGSARNAAAKRRRATPRKLRQLEESMLQVGWHGTVYVRPGRWFVRATISETVRL